MGTPDICVETFQGLFNPETNREARILILEKIFCWSSAPKTTKGQWTSDLVNGLILSQWPCFLWTKVSHWKLVPLNPQRFRFFHFGGSKTRVVLYMTSFYKLSLGKPNYQGLSCGGKWWWTPLKKRVEEKSQHFLKATQKWRFSKTANINISPVSETGPLCWQGHTLAPHLGSRTNPWKTWNFSTELGWFCRSYPA